MPKLLTYKCKHCNHKTVSDYQYCPNCLLDGEGLTAEDKNYKRLYEQYKAYYRKERDRNIDSEQLISYLKRKRAQQRFEIHNLKNQIESPKITVVRKDTPKIVDRPVGYREPK